MSPPQAVSPSRQTTLLRVMLGMAGLWLDDVQGVLESVCVCGLQAPT